MTQADAKAMLVTAFRALTKRQRQRLAWHLEHKTPICCGPSAMMFARHDGAG